MCLKCFCMKKESWFSILPLVTIWKSDSRDFENSPVVAYEPENRSPTYPLPSNCSFLVFHFPCIDAPRVPAVYTSSWSREGEWGKQTSLLHKVVFSWTRRFCFNEGRDCLIFHHPLSPGRDPGDCLPFSWPLSLAAGPIWGKWKILKSLLAGKLNLLGFWSISLYAHTGRLRPLSKHLLSLTVEGKYTRKLT